MTTPEAIIGLGSGSSNSNVAKIAIEQRKKKTDVVEPQVISEELLVDGVEEPLRPDGSPTPPIDFPKVTSMRLSCLNCIEISNLNNFDSLTTLRLDNNIIDTIQNLKHLQSLTWLDLSFNNIREIEGLDTLSKLTDLSLYHNQIEEIKGLDGCINLNILSLGHNQIKELKQIDNLRKFQSLRCVCLEGNKVCQHDSYNQHVHAYLPNLKYLDYMLIDKKSVQTAQEGYHLDELTELREREQAEAAKLRNVREKESVVLQLQGAFLDATEDLFEELFSKEVEPEHVTVLQCYGQLKEDYRDKLQDDINNLKTWMEEKNDTRLKKVATFERSVEQAEKESEDEAFQLVRNFSSLKKKVLTQLDSGETLNSTKVDEVVKYLVEDLTKLEAHLMANEVQLQESIEEAISEFEVRIEGIMKLMSERGNEFFRKLEELEKVFFTGLMEGANSEMDSFAQNQETILQDTETNKVKFLGNREEMHQQSTIFNDAHNALIQNKEDYMQNGMTNWTKSFFEKHRERQYHRNRQRIIDVKKVIDECREDINAAREAADYDAEGDDTVDVTYGR